MTKKIRLFLIIPALAAAAGFATQANANESKDGGGEGGAYVGTLYSEVGGGGFLCSCGPKNCKPCQ
jgi:hypothetical protein